MKARKNIIALALAVLALGQAAGFLYAQQRDRFVFAQIQYNGKWDPYPETWQDILEFIVTATSIRCEPERRVLSLADEALFSSPFVMILGSDDFPVLSEAEAKNLRKFLSNGGLLFVEDSSGLRGSRFDRSFRREIIKVFPERNLRVLPMNQPVFRSYYLLRKVAGRRITNNYFEGIEIGNRVAVIYSQNDLIGAWAKDRFGNYLWECNPGGKDQRFETQKLTLNLIMYSVTGTYKSDAIHQPFIEQKLRFGR